MLYFNPQGTRGPRPYWRLTANHIQIFQSTRPSRASTLGWFPFLVQILYFNPQGPRGPRRNCFSHSPYWFMISIHKALAGLDGTWTGIRCGKRISIHKALAGLDPLTEPQAHPSVISIHKALAGLDVKQVIRCQVCTDFNPQGPRGPRPGPLPAIYAVEIFQSTRPSRASTTMTVI